MAASRRVVGLKIFADLVELDDIKLVLKLWFVKLRQGRSIAHYSDGITCQGPELE